MSVDLAQMTAHLTPQQQDEIRRAYRKRAQNETTAFLLCFFLGIFGVHRMYLRQWGSALLHLLFPIVSAVLIVAALLSNVSVQVRTALIAVALVLLFLALVWEIIDLVRIDGQIHRYNLALAEELIAAVAISDPTVVAQAMAKLDSMVNAAEQRADSAARHDERAAEAVADAAATPTAATLAEASAANMQAQRLGAITQEDVAQARAVAEDASGASTGMFVSTTETRISGDPTAPAETPREWSVTATQNAQALASEDTHDALAERVFDPAAGVFGAAALAAGTAEVADRSIAESVTRAHSETSYSHTDSIELDETVASAGVAETRTQAADSADSEEAEETPFALEAVESIAGVQAQPEELRDDLTDHHPHVHHIKPVADVDAYHGAVIYVTLPHEDETLATTSETGNLAKDEGIAALSFGVEGLDMPPEAAFVPPVVPLDGPPVELLEYEAAPAAEAAFVVAESSALTVTSSGPEGAASETIAETETLAELAGLDDTPAAIDAIAAGAAASTLREVGDAPVDEAPAAAPATSVESIESAEATPPPEAPRLMKRVRVVRQIVVEGEVVQEQVVEELVPVDADTSQTAAHLQESLGHASAEQIAQMAHLSDTDIDVRQRTTFDSAGQPHPPRDTE